MKKQNQLSPKRQKFCEEYLIDFNGTQAAIRAGYAPRTAQEQSARLLSNAIVSNHVSELRKAQADSAAITVQRVIQELSRIATFDIRKLYNADGSLKNVHDLDDDTAAALIGIDASEIVSPDGELTGYLKKVKMADKNKAIEMLMRYFGAFNDRVEHTGQQNNVVIVLPDNGRQNGNQPANGMTIDGGSTKKS
jgi:phage terminase small subunit